MSNHHDDDKLNMLRKAATPAPSEAARRRALDAAMLAFDAERVGAQKPAQGNALIERLRSILANAKGTWTMNTRLSYGLSTAALALVLLPLGYQLYTSTAITPIGVPPVAHTTTTTEPTPTPEPLALGQTDADKKEAGNVTVSTDAPATDNMSTIQAAKPANEVAGLGKVGADEEGEVDLAVAEPMLDATAPPAPLETRQLAAESKVMASPPASGGSMQTESFAAAMPSTVAPADTMMAQPTTPSGDEFTKFSESPVKVVKNEPVSTFSIDVDTASYSYVRRTLSEGWVPEPDAVRIEELINYFDYNYPAPDGASTPFKPTLSIYPTPWNAKTQIVQIGIKGYVPPASEKKPSNLVFLIDTSGSMDEPDKLPLLKRAFALLVDQLGAGDTISIVAYAGSAGVVLEPTRATEKAKILDALENLSAGGSTAGAEGIELAYRLAEQAKVSNGVNRVILATDGDFNVGIEDPEELKTYIKQKRDTGVFLSVLGFGQGNLGDDTMQALAQNGNGNASYIDSFKEAQKVLVADAGGTLETIAKDVKIQVEFNPAVVSEYRLIGYETRALNREDFNNDKVDAGEIGAGTTVTALYEITPVGSGGELNDPLRYEQGGTAGAAPVTATPMEPTRADEIGYLKLRYKLPDGDSSTLVEQPITRADAVNELSQASDDSRFAAAVAAFGQKLKGSNYGDMTWDQIRALAQGARGTDEKGYRAEFMQLVDMATTLMPEPLCTAPEGNRNCR